MTDASVACPLGVLPGVRRHVQGVAADLRSGRSCGWLLPAAMATRERVRELLDLLGDAVRVVDVAKPVRPAPPAPARRPGGGVAVVGTVEEMLAGVFGPVVAPPPPPPEPPAADLTHRVLQAACSFNFLPVARTEDPLAALVDLRIPGGLAVVVHADHEPDPGAAGALLSRYSALLRERPAHPGRPVLLVVGTLWSLGEVEQDPLTTGVHWWWNVLSRLDLLTVATIEAGEAADATEGPGRRQRRCLDELCGDLVPEIVAEVAGPDLDLATVLARRWDGTRDGLVRLVGKTVEDTGTFEVAELGGGVADDRPPPRLREHWTAGRVEAWGGRIRPAVSAVSDAALEGVLAERLWIGQSRALNPALDEIRRALVGVARSGASVQALAEVSWHYCSGGEIDVIELNDLRKAAQKQIITLARLPRALLDEAVFARNDLAHRKVVDDNRLRELRRLVPLAIDQA